ncbi:hypothetical protein ACFOLA_10185 [Salinicoccus hispanicus]|uniref:DUF697 domain-containing protein n=1 Tax=Salinicoccus hispanicus TaxID=157225 RepID=A0A6N8TVK3_9STAP|nr:hypothetical protein [Salinicoccus hispanicus]MXQ49730.1 hypothetical protein [Salinicoccus hispanicus]
MGAQPLTENEIQIKEQEAREMVNKKALYSSIAAVLPIPLLDIGTDMKLMKDIRSEAEEIFELDHKQVNELSDDLMNRALVMATSMGSEFVGRNTSKFLFKGAAKNSKVAKFGLAPLATNALGAGVSYMLMKKLGHDYVDKCAEAARNQTV